MNPRGVRRMQLARQATVIVMLAVVLLIVWNWGLSEPEARGAVMLRPVAEAEPPSPEVERSIQESLSQLPSAEQIPKLEKARPGTSQTAGFVPTPGCSPRPVLLPLLKAPTLEALQCIWDGSDLNPHRVQVSAADRARCEEFVKSYLKSIDALRETANHAAMKEFRRRVASGDPSLPHLSWDAYLNILRRKCPSWVENATENGVPNKAKIPFAPNIAFSFDVGLFREAQGIWYAARVVDMGAARPAYEAMAFANLELIRAVLAFGVVFETLTQDEAMQLASALYLKFSEMIQ